MVEVTREENPDLEILRGRRVLLVEDDPTSRVLTRGLLQALDCTVVVANNGQEAVDIILEGEQTFDIVLMDIQMPVMDGFNATKILRKKGVNVPIIAHTSTFKPEQRQIFQDKGFNDAVSKTPVDIRSIADAVSRLLG